MTFTLFIVSESLDFNLAGCRPVHTITQSASIKVSRIQKLASCMTPNTGCGLFSNAQKIRNRIELEGMIHIPLNQLHTRRKWG